jgi:hypothetical protein
LAGAAVAGGYAILGLILSWMLPEPQETIENE